MSDFVAHDMLPKLFSEILHCHWTFLEAEESIQKLEDRKKLDGCLKELLCMVPHDRKFFLPETGEVLRKSILEMENFTAYKAIIGFDCISQYANNLFTKPWRKEFRVLKTYSGFYQHEVKSNLLDAEKLFEAMGYRRLTDDTLILEGPICPDQVTNVSRDAMAAYVECQIMKHIYAGLLAIGLSVSWQDVFYYREKHTGGSAQAIKAIAYAMQEKRARKEKIYSNENNYATIQHASPMATNQCQCASLYHQLPQSHYMQQHSGACAVHSNPISTCALHPHASSAQSANLMYNGNAMGEKLIASYPAPSLAQHPFVAPAHLQQPHMTHSRSLEHYNEPHAPLPHRHSFDQQQQQQQSCTAAHHYQQLAPTTHPHVYESPYDCLDGVSMGSSGASYAAVTGGGSNSTNYNNAYTQLYNAPGNRYPLPYSISSQLNTHYATPVAGCNGNKPADPYTAGVDNSAYATVSKPHTCNYHAQQQQLQQQQPPLPSTRSGMSTTGAAPNSSAMHYRQRSFPPDQLIDFDDRAPLAAHDYHAQMHAAALLDYERDHRNVHDRRPTIRANMHAAYAQPKDMVRQQQQQQHDVPPPLNVHPTNVASDMYVYARPVPKSSRSRQQQAATVENSNLTDKYIRSTTELIQDCVDNNRKLQTELKEHNLRLNGGDANDGNCRRKISVHTNDRDTSDLTSYESGSLEDFVPIGHGESANQHSKNQDGVGSFESWNYVFQNLERSGYSKDLGDREDLLVQSLGLDSLTLANNSSGDKRRSAHTDAKAAATSRGTNANASAQINGEKSRTLEKASTATSKRGATPKVEQKTVPKQQSTGGGMASGGKKVKSALKTAIIDNRNGNARIARYKQPPPVPTQVTVTSPNEWSCRFCTFLNPDTKRVCEMCCRSKDFNPEPAAVTHTPTCV